MHAAAISFDLHVPESRSLKAKRAAVRPIVDGLRHRFKVSGAEVVGSPARLELGQLAGRNHTRLDGGARSDGTPDRVLAQWTVRGEAGSQVTVEARHQRAGVARDTIRLGG